MAAVDVLDAPPAAVLVEEPAVDVLSRSPLAVLVAVLSPLERVVALSLVVAAAELAPPVDAPSEAELLETCP